MFIICHGVGYGTLLMQWFNDAMKEKVMRYNITITLLNPQGEAAMVWFAENCLPFKWTGPALKSDDKVIAIQKLEFTCGEITCNVLT
jgi:phage tail-like protein